MAEQAYPFETSPATVGRWARMARMFAPSGIVGAPSATSPHYALTWSGLTASIGYDVGAAGSEAFVRGFVHRLDTAPHTAAVPANTAASPRVDRFVIRRDLAAQTATIVRLQGTPAATPLPPALLADDDGIYDLPLWRFTVPANSGTVITGIIDERRWSDPAGGARGTIAHVKSTASAATTSSAQVRLAGGHNLAATLQAGRQYELVFAAVAVAGGSGTGRINVMVRIGPDGNITPTTASPIASSWAGYFQVIGGPGANTCITAGQPFQVSADGTYGLHVFADTVGGPATMTLVPMSSGFLFTALNDLGPALSDTRVLI